MNEAPQRIGDIVEEKEKAQMQTPAVLLKLKGAEFPFQGLLLHVDGYWLEFQHEGGTIRAYPRERVSYIEYLSR